MFKTNFIKDGATIARHGRMFARHVVPAVVKPARTLWNEVIGFFFLCFAVVFGFKLIRSIREFNGSPGDVLNLGGLVFCFALMAGFGISSFLRARKISRS